MTLTRLCIAVGGLIGAAFFAWVAWGALEVGIAFGSNSVTLLGCKMPLSMGLAALIVVAGACLVMAMAAFLIRGEDGE